MRRWLFMVFLGWMSNVTGLIWAAEGLPAGVTPPAMIVVVGAAGEEEFGREFRQTAELWQKASTQAGGTFASIGSGTTNDAPDSATGVTDLARLEKVLQELPREAGGDVWLILIGHGTFDGREARFNLSGPDLTATDLARMVQPIHRRLIVINGASSSSPFLSKLSGPGRVIVTATRSGYEENVARFGRFLAVAISDTSADLDKDGQVSLLEAFVLAARRVAEFYETEGRLATEHALIDDNGDGAGTPADWFRGVHAIKKAEGGSSLDGLRAHQVHLVRSAAERGMPDAQRARRDELEAALAKLRESRAKLDPEEYYRRLEPLLLDLARLYGGSKE